MPGFGDLETPGELVAALEAELAEIPAHLGKQIEALSELFRLFTSERSNIRRLSYLDTPKLRSAYLRYHLPLNTARATWVLRDVAHVHPRLAELTEVVDLGAGLGSASLATLFALPRAVSRAYALHDKSRSALKAARRILERCAKGGGMKSLLTSVAPLPALPQMPRKSLVWLSMVLNELYAGSRRGLDTETFLSRLAERLDPPSVVLVMEPALREPGRRLLALHDAAVASGAWRVLAPCTHQLACPLLRERDRSWCHFRFRWSAPKLVRDVADPLRLEHGEPSLAYLALERLPRGASLPTTDPRRARVIGDPMPVQGAKSGVYVCRQGKREVLLDDSRRLRRGEVTTV